jgi:hypothetical protein
VPMRGEEKGSGRGGREGRVVRGEEEGGWIMGGGVEEIGQ